MERANSSGSGINHSCMPRNMYACDGLIHRIGSHTMPACFIKKLAVRSFVKLERPSVI